MPPQLDEIDVDAGWQPPADDQRVDRRGGLPGPAKAGIVLLALAVVVGGIWALGGFKVRTDVRHPVAPGTLVVSGPYEFTFTHATAQKKKEYDDSIKWIVIAEGTGRTTGDESISPMTGGSGMFAAADPNTVEAPDAESDIIGPGESYDGPSDFTPGIAPLRYRVEFNFSEHYKPDKFVKFAVFEIEYSNNHIIDTGEKTWHNTRDAFVYQLPITVLPPDVDD